jgi:hypothetical protein
MIVIRKAFSALPIYVCTYVRTHVRSYGSTYVYMYVSTCVCMYARSLSNTKKKSFAQLVKTIFLMFQCTRYLLGQLFASCFPVKTSVWVYCLSHANYVLRPFCPS